MHRTAAVLGTLVALAVAGAPASAQDDGLPEAMRRLEAFEGSWRAERVEFLDPDGSVRAVSTARARNELQMGGRVMVHEGRLDDPRLETRGWYFWDPEEERLRMGSVTSGGRYDEFVGGWEGDRLVMLLPPSEALGGRSFRMIHSDFTEDSFRERLEMSEDGGESWRVTSRQVMRRVGGDAERVLAALDRYEGHWRSDEKTGAQGERFHFEYDERWMDPGETIARIHIEQVMADGTRVTLFDAFKGREPSGDGVYYHAASPAGRAARGEVRVEGDDLVTEYDGWTAEGGAVRIRDVFTPVEDGSFVSRTYLRRSPEAEWRRIGEDRWTRTGPSRGGGR